MSKRLWGWLAALPLPALAATPAASPAPTAAAQPGVGAELFQLVGGLLLVLVLIFALAWLVRRLQRNLPGAAQVIDIVGSRALGPRDRLVLVQVGQEQILLGLSPGNITALHVMQQPVTVDATAQKATPEFAQRLMELMGKDHKDRK